MATKCKKCDECVPKRGERGLKGETGLQGPVGPQGPQGVPGQSGNDGTDGINGINGNNGADGDPKTVTFQDSCDIVVEEVVGSPDYEFRLNINDSGWVDLLGFNHYGVNMQKPQVRRIGNVLHFRGNAIVPLSSDNGTTLISMTLGTDYDRKAYAQVYTGSGGVNVNNAGSITWNNGNAVIPPAILCSKLIDGSYSQTRISQRQIIVGGTVTGGTVSAGAEGVSLSAWFGVIITQTGTLVIQTLKDVEQSAVADAGVKTGGSPLRYITSNVKKDDHVPKFNDVLSVVHGNIAGGTVDIKSLFLDEQYNFTCDAAEPDDIGGFGINLNGIIAYLTI